MRHNTHLSHTHGAHHCAITQHCPMLRQLNGVYRAVGPLTYTEGGIALQKVDGTGRLRAVQGGQ